MNAALGQAVLAHLDAQLQSAQYLLELILRQGRAIRAREVEQVLTLLAAIQAEVERRTHLEAARTELLGRGVEVGEVSDVGGGVRYAGLGDPDGNTLVLQEMAWRTGDAW